MSDSRRLIEVAFPLEQASIDSVHEKTVRHGHISTLHIWPARRPLAAARAALIATLLPDPGTPEKRRELVDRLGGRVVKVLKKKQGPGGGEEKVVKETVGGVLHWGRETQNKADLDFFREEIRRAYGGHAPRVLDPFAGGGAIPLEAMRLGCDVTALDINPVAWFILKCTLEYPHQLSGHRRPLPEFVLTDPEFMGAYFKAQGMKGAMLRSQLKKLGLEDQRRDADHPTLQDVETGRPVELAIEPHTLNAGIAWHVRAWGWWVLRAARLRLATYYPVYADWQPLEGPDDWRSKHPEQVRPLQQVPLRADGTEDIDALNAHLAAADLADERKPRWVQKPAVAYLWARTVTCKHCRATIPLLKTRWLSKRKTQRVLLTMEPNRERTGVSFGVQTSVAVEGGNNAQRREHDKRIGGGTMSRAGAWCPCCGRPGTVAMGMNDIRAEGLSQRIGAMLTAVAVDGPDSKEFRLPTDLERSLAAVSDAELEAVYRDVPFGIPNEEIAKKEAPGIRVPLYGFDRWCKLYSRRQLLSLGVLLSVIRESSRELMQTDTQFGEAVFAYLLCGFSRLLDFANHGVQWKNDVPTINHSFVRFALPITWDYAEGNVIGRSAGSFSLCVDRVAIGLDTLLAWNMRDGVATAQCSSAKVSAAKNLDLVITDPPYYGAIPYSDLMDFFYVWLRRGVQSHAGLSAPFRQPLAPKWDSAANDGELIDDASRHGGDGVQSRHAYESGMAEVFANCGAALKDTGRLVVVFANKQPEAWETLVAALIRSGFVVDGSWPIQTEQASRMRAISSAALASSVWLVCRKREGKARPGWDNVVLEDMRKNIGIQLRSFWDAGIHGPDFVWAATGPALEAYSKHPIVKKANAPGETMSVGEFLKAVRRLVVEFVVGRVLGEAAHVDTREGEAAAASLDDVTTYYLLHRHDFAMDDAPAGACILYALSCNLSEGELADRYDLLVRTGGVDVDDDGEGDEGDADADGEVEEGSGSTFKLKPWKQRRRPTLGIDPIAEQARRAREEFEARGPVLFDEMGPNASSAARSRVIPLIDSIHRLMHLWVDGDVAKVNEYLDDRGLRRRETFRQVLQALIELSETSSEERSVLESLSNHVRALGERTDSLFDRTRG